MNPINPRRSERQAIDPADPPQWAIDGRHSGPSAPDDAPDGPPAWAVALLPDVEWVGGELQ